LPDLVGCNPSGTKKQVHIIPARKDWLSIAETIAARLRETAVAREHAAVPPLEISWLRDADLLTLLNPAQAGGDAAAFSDAFRVVRRLARADTRGQLDRAIVELSLSTVAQCILARDRGTAGKARTAIGRTEMVLRRRRRDALTLLTADGVGFRLNGR
jgi:hypothetical protein